MEYVPCEVDLVVSLLCSTAAAESSSRSYLVG